MDKVALMHVVQGLAHAYWKVGQAGAYSFFYKSLRAPGFEVVADYDFDWSNIRGTNVHDSEGNALGISTKLQPLGDRSLIITESGLRTPMKAKSSLPTRLSHSVGVANMGSIDILLTTLSSRALSIS